MKGEVQVHPVQVVAVQHEALQLVLTLWPHDDAHVREDVLTPLRYLPVVLQPVLLLELPADVISNLVLLIPDWTAGPQQSLPRCSSQRPRKPHTASNQRAAGQVQQESCLAASRCTRGMLPSRTHGQGSTMASDTLPFSLPTMSSDSMGMSYSSFGYSTQCITCRRQALCDVRHWMHRGCGHARNLIMTFYRSVVPIKKKQRNPATHLCNMLRACLPRTSPAYHPADAQARCAAS